MAAKSPHKIVSLNYRRMGMEIEVKYYITRVLAIFSDSQTITTFLLKY